MKFLLIKASYDVQSIHGLHQYSIGIYAPIDLKKSKDLPEKVSSFINSKLKREREINGFGGSFMGSWIDSMDIINGQNDTVFDIE